MRPYHFYVAFNPLFNGESPFKTQAHEFYHLLKEKIAKDPKAYLYWGKLQVSAYSEPMNFENFPKVTSENDELQMDTHLYITDYHHLWVGRVSGVSEEILDKENTLPFYHDKKVEVWFKLEDFDLLSNDADETSRMLGQLYVDNEYSSEKRKEVSSYSMGLRFPMIVQDHSLERFFKKPNIKFHRILMDNPLLKSSGEEMKLGKIVQSYVIPEENFKRFPDKVRDKILHAEILLLEAQARPQTDRKKLEHAILSHLRCLEILLNETFVEHLKKTDGPRIFVTKDGPLKFLRSPMDKDKATIQRLADCQGLFGLSQLKMLLDTTTFFNHTSLDQLFASKQLFWEYCRLELRPTLKNESLVGLKELLEKGGEVKVNDRELLLIRNILLGVGSRGLYNKIVEAFYGTPIPKNKAA